MTTTEEVAAFIAREFPQTKCGVREVGQGGAVVFHEIGREELRPGGTVSGPTLMAVADLALYAAILGEIGIVPLDNMIPETALMKLSWVLAHTRDQAEVSRMMRTPVSHEITPREPHNGYLVMQGGLPEIEEWIKTHWK